MSNQKINSKTEDLKEKLHKYIDAASTDELEDMLCFLEDEIDYGKAAMEEECLNDDDLLKDLDQRIQDFESGKDKGVSWEQVHREALERTNKE